MATGPKKVESLQDLVCAHPNSLHLKDLQQFVPKIVRGMQEAAGNGQKKGIIVSYLVI